VDTPTWTAKFTIQQRAVPAMHVGRCFVSGDAAHVHSPAGGQGLNTGIQDAYNLAWKMAMVVHGQADAALLDSYDAERVPVGQALLASTAATNSAVGGSAPKDAQNSDQSFIRKLIWSASGRSIAYTDSPLTVQNDEPGKGPQPGQRLTQISAADAQSPGWIVLRTLLRTSAWHLLVFAERGQSTSQNQVSMDTTALPAWLDRVTISQSRLDGDAHGVWDSDSRVQDTLGATDGDWILVRPDGYLSARGTGDTHLREALNRLASLHV